MPPAAPVNTILRFLSSAIATPPRQASIALQRARQVIAHRPPCLRRTGGGDCGDDAAMLLLQALEIEPALGRRVDGEPHALPGDDMAAEKLQEARELPV